MLPKLCRAHAGAVPEKLAEIKFTGEVQLRGDILHLQAFVRQQQPRLIEPRTLDVFVNRALAGAVE